MASRPEPSTPGETVDVRRLVREKTRRERAAVEVYRELSEHEQRSIDAWAREKAKAQVMATAAVDGPRFGPPWGAFWGLVAAKRDMFWLERMWNEYGRSIRAKLDAPAEANDWINSDVVPQRTASSPSIAALLRGVGAMPSGLESRPRSQRDMADEWGPGRE